TRSPCTEPAETCASPSIPPCELGQTSASGPPTIVVKVCITDSHRCDRSFACGVCLWLSAVYDFSPSPEQQRIVERVVALMDELVYPNETAFVPSRGLPRQLLRELQARVKTEGLWAAHLPKEAGGLGMGNVTLGLINEQLGRSPIAARIFGTSAPDTGNSEI